MLSFLFAAQLAVATIAADSTYATPALRDLVARAASANKSPPPEFRSYHSHIETELSLLLRDSLGREHTAQVEQLATRAAWARTGRYDLHVVGYRSQTIGVPYSALSIVQGWTVPSLYGDRLYLGAYPSFASSPKSRSPSDSLIAVHPFAADRERYYRFYGGDTVTILRVGDRRIPLVRIHVVPTLVDPPPVEKGHSLSVGAFQGEIDLDAERAQIVRMRGRFIVIGKSSTESASCAACSAVRRGIRATLGVVAVVYAEFVNAEINGKYWLPAFQRTEFQAGLAILGQTRPVFRLVSTISDIAVNEDSSVVSADSISSLRVLLSWAPQDSISNYNSWIRGLGEQSSSVHSDDFVDLAPNVWRTTGPPRLRLFPNTSSRIIRFNRVEGLFTGVAPSVDFRSLAPGLTIGAQAGWAWSEKTVRGGAFGSYRRGGSTYGVRAERALVTTNDFLLPLSGDEGIFGLLSSIDNYDYVDRKTAMLSVARTLGSVDAGLLTFQIGAGDDHSEVQRLDHGLISRSLFRPNRGASSGSYAIAAADLELHPNVTGDFVQPGVGARAHYEAATGNLEWQRAELGLSARRYFGPIALAAHADGGIVTGRNLPPQQLFELGGDEALPGYAYKEFVGDRAALFRTFASYRFPIWRRPIRLWRNFMVSGVSPGLAISAQGGWTELSSPAAAASALALGVDQAGMPISNPTHGMRATVGGGLTFFGNLLHLGAARPVDHPAPWRFVIGVGPAF